MSIARKVVALNPRRVAMFVCDIQDRFRTEIFDFPHVISTASKMLEAGKVLESKIIVTEQYPKALGSTVKELDISTASICAAKTKFSMVTPEVEPHLKDIDSVILFGIESHVCVLQTCFDLINRGIDVHVLADGVSSGNRFEIGIALQRMRSVGATITTSDSILFQLVGDAKAEKFKDISNIVKKYMPSTKSNPLAYTQSFQSSL